MRIFMSRSGGTFPPGFLPMPEGEMSVLIREMAIACTIAVVACGGSPTEPSEERVLGVVAASSPHLYISDGTPTAWIVEGRRIEVEITTVGFCDVTRSDWEVAVTQRPAEGGFGTEAFVFILPYEYRETRCGENASPDRGGNALFLHTDTLALEFSVELEATVRVISWEGTAYDTWLDFHPGWPPPSP